MPFLREEPAELVLINRTLSKADALAAEFAGAGPLIVGDYGSLAQAKEEGVGNIAEGVGMLVEQAAEAFHWWRGVRPETKAVVEALTVPLI